MVPQAIKYQLRDYLIGGETLGMKLIDENHFMDTEDQLLDLITEKNLTKVLAELNTTRKSSEIYVVSPTTKWRDCPHFDRVPIFRTEEAMVIVRTADIILLRRFFSGIAQCFGIIFFAIIFAINISAVIWFIERNSNPDFQNTFGRGLWTSFWYCFVTMTTVGYGDKVPKHFISRFLCLAWMLFGVMLTATITASIIETVQAENPKANKKIAITRSRLEASVVINKIAGIPVEYNSYHDIIKAVQTSEVDAGVLDVNVAAYIFKRDDIQDLKMESTLSMHKTIWAYIYHNKDVTKLDFLFDEKAREIPEEEIIRVRGIYVPAYKVKRYYSRSFEELFNKQDGGLVFYLTILSGFFIFVGVASEIIVRIWPNAFKKKKSKEVDQKRSVAIFGNPNEMSSESKLVVELEEVFNAKILKLKKQLNDNRELSKEITITSTNNNSGFFMTERYNKTYRSVVS